MVCLKISATERDLENHQKLPNFAGLLWPSHLTKIWSWGTNGKRISISFIWYLVMQNISIILATLTTFTTRGQTENEKMGSDMSILSEVPDKTQEILQKNQEISVQNLWIGDRCCGLTSKKRACFYEGYERVNWDKSWLGMYNWPWFFCFMIFNAKLRF